jgi:hypothetical protein
LFAISNIAGESARGAATDLNLADEFVERFPVSRQRNDVITPRGQACGDLPTQPL